MTAHPPSPALPNTLSSEGTSLLSRLLRGWTLRRAYLVMLVALGILTLSNTLLESGLDSLRGDAQWTNVAGRQRMLSQRIAWDATRLVGARGPEQVSTRTRLRQTLTQFREGHCLLSDPLSTLHSARGGPSGPACTNSNSARGYRTIKMRWRACSRRR